ncbi:LacI family DNA-binding transcriptional regulator [Humibacter ginsengisoli]
MTDTPADQASEAEPQSLQHGAPTLDDVAPLAQVSIGTVSNYFHRPEHLAPSTRERVGRAVAELGYEANRSARALATGGGPTRPTIRDVAREAGVSYQTVSRALNHPDIVTTQVLRRVTAAIDSLGFEPNTNARALRRHAAGRTEQTDAEVNGFASPTDLLAEEDDLILDRLDEAVCYRLGATIADRGLAAHQPLAVSVRLGELEVFRVRLPGATDINEIVLIAKWNRARMSGHSRLYERNVRLARGTTFEEETGLAFPKHAPYGGAVPLRVDGDSETKAYVIVSGLSQKADHALAVNAIRKLHDGGPQG